MHNRYVRVLMAGQIECFADVSLACRVLNLSDLGALILVSDAVPVPMHFRIKIRDKSYSAEVRWRKEIQIGVKFFVEASAEMELTTFQTARDLREARMENKMLKSKEKALLKKLADLGYVEADEF
jgi:hypothetical protein